MAETVALRPILDSLVPGLRELCGERLREVILFGSHARPQACDSH